MSNAPHELHITIVVAGARSTLSLTHEIEMVKAALLYADRVTLASPRATMVATVGALSDLGGRERTEALLQMASQLPDAHHLHRAYTTLKRTRHKTKEELLTLRRIERELAAAGDALSAKAAEIAHEAGLGELSPAVEEGLLDVDLLGLEDGDTDKMVHRLSELIAQIVSPESTSMPMMDDASGGLLKAMMAEGIIPQARLEGAAQARIASRFIAWVPAFPDASLESVLSAREHLKTPLIRYRSAVVGLSRDLQTSPLDDSFEQVVRDLYTEQARPALLEIEELSQQLGLRASVANAARSGAGRRVAEATVGFVAADAAGIPPILVSTLGVGVDITAQIIHERSQVKEEQRENRFFFLYESGRILGQA